MPHGDIQAHKPALLPPPQTLAEYDQLVPGAAHRILSMTERSVAAKVDIVDRLASAEVETAKAGLIVVTGLTMLAFAAAAVFFALGNRMAGIAFVSFSVILFIRSFLVRLDNG